MTKLKIKWKTTLVTNVKELFIATDKGSTNPIDFCHWAIHCYRELPQHQTLRDHHQEAAGFMVQQTLDAPISLKHLHTIPTLVDMVQHT